MNKVFHDIINDLSVAIGLVEAFIDGKLLPDHARFGEILDALKDADASIAELRAQQRPAGTPRTNSLLSAVVEGSPYAKVLVDENGRITLVNVEAERMFGYSRAEILGRSVETLVPSRLRGKHPDLRHSYNQEPEARPMGAGRDLQGRHKSGREFPIEIGLNPIETDGGAFTLPAISDITERKRGEELRLLHAGVAAHAAELEQLNVELANASRFKTQFIATMSHELRTPLSAIIGATELLAAAKLSEREASHVAAIGESAEALFALTGSILDFSKIEAGKIELRLEPIRIASIVDSAMGVVGPLVRGKDVALRAEIDPAIPVVIGDGDRLRQILLNLLGNAAKFTDRGQIYVRALLVRTNEGATHVRFEVEDTAGGIAPEFLPRVFEPFAQGVSAKRKQTGGSGLGLSISKRLVELMGGEVGVTSEWGRGSIFWFTAAFESIDDPAALPLRIVERTASLILSDDDTFAASVEKCVASRSMESKRVRSGVEVLETLRTPSDKRWVAVIDLDGLSDAGAGVMTTILQTLESERIVVLGKTRALRKPVPPAALLEAIRKAATVESSDDARGHSSEAISGTGETLKPILVAEDDERLQRLLALQFDALGVPVRFVSDGAAAVEAIRRADFAMVFMDCRMPRLDGMAATRAIRDIERTTGRHVTIAAMTADAFSEDREACLAAGMDDYLPKPVRLGDLRSAIERWSRRSLATS